MQQDKSKVLIVGAGIGGLAIANLLDKSKFDIEIIEKRQHLNDDGYVIGIWANGLHALRNMPDLFKKMTNRGVISDFQLLMSAKEKHLRYTNLANLNKKYGGVVVFVSRGELHKSLLSALPNGVNIVLNNSVVAIENGEIQTQVTLQNGEKKSYDIVIGADGLNSSIRKIIEKGNHIIEHNADFFYCLLPKPATIPPVIGDVEMIGKGDFVGVYPYGTDGNLGLYMCIANATPQGDTIQLLKSKLHYFGSPFKECLADLNENTAIFRDKLREVSLPEWHKAQVVLLGDAAHAMLPTTGQGISAALEDAVELSDLLNQPYDNLQTVFSTYQNKRKPLTDAIQKRSRILNYLVLLQNPLLCWGRDILIWMSGLMPKEKSLDKFFANALKQQQQ